MKRKHVALLLTMALSMSLFACGTTESKDTKNNVDQINDSSSDECLEVYSDDYVSFEYDSNLFSVDYDQELGVISIDCPSMPEEPAGTHNTVLGIITYPIDDFSLYSDSDTEKFLTLISKKVCQGLFELNDDETIISENTSYSDFSAEYKMEISDGSTCYARTLNYNTEFSIVILRTCEYSSDFNESFLNIYNSVYSTLGNYELASEEAPSDTTIENTIPSIKGSQAYDIILGLEDNGIPKADAINNDDGFQFNSTTIEYSYSITTNSDHEVMCASFMVLSPEDSKGYLAYCATLPYDTADPEKATQWVTDNIGSEAETAIGDAIFTITQGNQGPILVVKAMGYDEYVLSKI